MTKPKINFTGGRVDNFGGTFIHLGKDADGDIKIDGLEINNYTVGEFRPKTVYIEGGSSLTEKLELLKKDKPEEFTELLTLIQNQNPAEQVQIDDESKFRQALSLLADTAGLSTTIIQIIVWLLNK